MVVRETHKGVEVTWCNGASSEVLHVHIKGLDPHAELWATKLGRWVFAMQWWFTGHFTILVILIQNVSVLVLSMDIVPPSLGFYLLDRIPILSFTPACCALVG